MKLTLISLGLMASTAVAVASPGFDFPDSVPMDKRATTGPAYQCHAKCGMLP